MIRPDMIITRIDRQSNSTHGNPQFMVTFANGASAPTKVDAAVGYGIQNEKLHNVPVFVEFDNKTGHIVYVRTMDGRFES